MSMLRWLIVGLVAGFAMSKALPNADCGTPVDVVLGALGAVGGGAIMHAYGFGMATALPVAVLGSIVLICVIHLASRGGSRTGTSGKDISKAA